MRKDYSLFSFPPSFLLLSLPPCMSHFRVDFNFASGHFRHLSRRPTHNYDVQFTPSEEEWSRTESVLAQTYPRGLPTWFGASRTLLAVLAAFADLGLPIPLDLLNDCVERTSFASYADRRLYSGEASNPLREFAVIRYLATTEELSYHPRWLRDYLKYLSAPSYAYYTTVDQFHAFEPASAMRRVFELWRSGDFRTSVFSANKRIPVGFPVDYSGRRGYCPLQYRPSPFGTFEQRRAFHASRSGVSSSSSSSSSAAGSGTKRS